MKHGLIPEFKNQPFDAAVASKTRREVEKAWIYEIRYDTPK